MIGTIFGDSFETEFGEFRHQHRNYHSSGRDVAVKTTLGITPHSSRNIWLTPRPHPFPRLNAPCIHICQCHCLRITL